LLHASLRTKVNCVQRSINFSFHLCKQYLFGLFRYKCTHLNTCNLLHKDRYTEQKKIPSSQQTEHPKASVTAVVRPTKFWPLSPRVSTQDGQTDFVTDVRFKVASIAYYTCVQYMRQKTENVMFSEIHTKF